MDKILEKAKDLLDNEKFKDAIELLEKHEDARKDCHFALYEIFSEEKYPIYDPERAKNIIKKLSSQRYIPAKYEWAKMFFYGIIEEKNYESAEKIFREVANEDLETNKEFFLEITNSCDYLGKIFENGLQLGDKDIIEALRFYKKATKNEKLIESYFSVAKLVLENDSSKYHEAIKYLEHSASKGHLNSVKLLTKIYTKLMKINLNKIIKLDNNSIDAIVINDKIKTIDEDILI